MIYVDTSVIVAQLLAEDRAPSPSLWSQPIVSSRLLAYEVWTRVHARGLGRSHGDAVRQLLARVAWLELTADVLARALEPWPVPVRTLDALHLASLLFLRRHDPNVALAAYDDRLAAAARRLDVPLWPI